MEKHLNHSSFRFSPSLRQKEKALWQSLFSRLHLHLLSDSHLDIDHETETDSLNDWLNFDIGLDIQKVCEGYDLEPDFFLHETIDEKAALLMEVPVLPQPNELPKDFYVPMSFSDFVILSTAKGGQHQPNARFQAYRFLKKEFNMTLELLDSVAVESFSKSLTEISVCRGLEDFI